MSPEAPIVTAGLTKRYGELTAVDNLDLELRRGCGELRQAGHEGGNRKRKARQKARHSSLLYLLGAIPQDKTLRPRFSCRAGANNRGSINGIGQAASRLGAPPVPASAPEIPLTSEILR